MNGLLQDIGALIVTFIFTFLIFMVLIRLIFQILRADFYNPISQGIVKLTNPFVLPFRRVIPGLWGIDLASVVVVVILQAIEVTLLYLLNETITSRLLASKSSLILPILVLSLNHVVSQTVWIFIGAIGIRIILSWVSPYGTSQNPLASLVYSVSEPVMRPFRRILPPMGGFDLSPMLLILVLYIILLVSSRVFSVLFNLV